MPTAKGTVTQFYQYKASGPGGRKAPAKLIVDHGGGETGEYKSWAPVNVEIGQEVEITYETTVSGGYSNNMILDIKVTSGGGGGRKARRDDATGASIESQVAYKGAVELVVALINNGHIKPGAVEAELEGKYQASISLIRNGTTYDPASDE